MEGDEDDLDEKMVLITSNFKRFPRKKVGVIPSRKQDDKVRGKEIKRVLKIKEKKNSKDIVQWYKCKGYGHVAHECPSKDKDHDPKGKKVLQTTLKLDDKISVHCVSEFCFMTIKEKEKRT